MNYEIQYPKKYVKPKLPAKAWLEAIRSGEYKQGSRVLCSDSAYCCLGVLSKIQGRLKNGKDGEENTGIVLSKENPLIEYLDENGRLPRGVKVWRSGEDFNSLAVLNDKGFTFSEIADIIEQIWEVTE